MAQNVGITPVIAPIDTPDSNDTFPTGFANKLKGGYKTVATIAERDAIPLERRSTGDLVKVVETNLIYHWNGTSFDNNIKNYIGLSNVDNTSDLNKPISTATQTALDNKLNTSQALVQSFAIGVYNASTNSPTLSATPDVLLNNGSYYDVTVSGTLSFSGLNFSSGIVVNVGDRLVKYGTQWGLNVGANISKIPSWTYSVYTSGSQVIKNGKIWQSASSTLASDEPGISSKWIEVLSGYSSLEIDSLNLFNKNGTFIQFVSGITGTSDIYDGNSFIKNALGMNYNSGDIFMSNRIYLSSLKPNAVISPSSNNTNRVYYYDASGSQLSVSADGTRLATWTTNVAWVRFSFTGANINTTQIEYNTVATTYTNYDGTVRLSNSQIPKTVALKTDLSNYATTSALNTGLGTKADTEVDSLNLFNKDTAKIQFVSGQTGSIDNYLGTSILKDCLGTSYNSFNISTSPRVYLTVSQPTAVISGSSGNSYRVYYYDSSGNQIGVSANNTLVANLSLFPSASWVRFSYDNTKENITQIEYGITPSTYQAFDATLRLKKTQIPKTVALKSELLGYAPIENDTLNLFNKNASVVQFISGQTGSIDSYTSTSILRDCLGTSYNSFGISTSPRIYLTKKTPYAIISPTSNNSSRVYYYDSNGNQLGVSSNGTLIADYNSFVGVSWVRFSYSTSLESTIQIEYGTSPTSYKDYDNSQKAILRSLVPQGIAWENNIPSLALPAIENAQGKSKKIILPSKLYYKTGVENLLYFDNIIKKNQNDRNFLITNSNNTGNSVFSDFIRINPSSAASFNTTLNLAQNGVVISSKTTNIQYVASPSSAKNIKIMSIGNSISDLGTWQKNLKDQLTIDNITSTFIGTMTLGASTNQIFGEVKSGGDLSFLTTSGTDAKILTVSNITTLPVTSYPGTFYIDANNNEWVVRGFKLTQGGDGKYSGKLKLGIFSSDPNLGGGSSGSNPSGTFPTSGTITKSNTQAGDSTINYTAVDNAYYNPFWNPSTNLLDFNYYFTYWGLSTPDVILMQWGFNDVGAGIPFKEKTESSIALASSRAKTFIDTLHTQYPNIKVIFGVDPFGASLPLYTGGTQNVGYKKYNILSFLESIIDTLDISTYSSYVYVIPTFATFNHELGYGNTVLQNFKTDVYSTQISVKTLASGVDGVHPSGTTFGSIELANAYRGILNLISNSL
jgi:hypothetical protein